MRNRKLTSTCVTVLLLAFPALSTAGALYALGSNGTIYDVPSTGTATPVATGSGFALAMDSAGNFYTENASGGKLNQITPGGVTTTYATDSTGSLIHGVESLTFDAAGNLYDSNPANGTIGVVGPGGGTVSAFASGLNYPYYLAVSPAGNIYATSAHLDEIYKISPRGSVGSITPSLGAPGVGGMAIDAAGNLYYVTGNDTIGKIAPDGTTTALVTDPTYAFGALAVNDAGDVLAATQYDSIIEVTPSGQESTFATLPTGITSLVESPVPEPATVALFAPLAAWLLRRRQRAGRPDLAVAQ